MMTRKHRTPNGIAPAAPWETKRGRGVSAPAPGSSAGGTGRCRDYSPTGVNAPAFALKSALWNSRLSRAMNFTLTPFGHAAWHS